MIFAGPGNDRVRGNRGDDYVDGGLGDDVLFGGITSGPPRRDDGYDVLLGRAGDDRLAGGWQKDGLFGGPGADRLRGGPHGDRLVGEAGPDDVAGETGDDLLLARDRTRDVLWGGPGFDRATIDRVDRRAGIERLLPRWRSGRGRRDRLAFPGAEVRSETEPMATMADLDELALALPQTTKEVSDDGRPAYSVNGKLFCVHRGRRPDATDPETGERLADVLMFRVPDLDVKDLLLADERGVFFTTPHFRGYPAVLIRIPDLAQLDREELRDMVVEAWSTRAPKRVAKAWLDQHAPMGDSE